MRLIPDTNTLNYLLKGRPLVVERFGEANREGAEFLLSSVTHFELTRYLDLKGAHRLRRAYERITKSWRRCNLDFEDWGTAAGLWARRHRLGRSISDLDLLLAALTRRENAVLITSNVRHFVDLGIDYEDWASPV
ncbi:MAG TPA: PIN domain-containing protein [Thermoanaerobaculia bacterium]|jgi:predicted nucleic acid-binding protein